MGSSWRATRVVNVPVDVVLAPAHVRALRLEREAKRRLEAADVAIPEVNLARYDTAVPDYGVSRVGPSSPS